MVLQISFRSTETFPFCQSHHESVGMGKYFLRMRTNQKLDCLLCQSPPLYSVTKIRAAMKTKSRHHHYVNFVKQCLTAQNCAITDWLFHKSVCSVLWNNFHMHKMNAINICKKETETATTAKAPSLSLSENLFCLSWLQLLIDSSVFTQWIGQTTVIGPTDKSRRRE